jgi:hypothetical protein
MKRLILCLILVSSHYAFAWGERGHHVLCEAATRLVKNPDLAQFLQGRGHQAGHVCNIPDFHWRNLPSQTKVGENSHFLDPENLGYTVATLPTNFSDIATAKGLTKVQVAIDLGSLWWRADQFFRRAKTAAEAARLAPLPAPADAQNHEHPYNKAVYQFFTDLYLMGHFAGDASMPYHNTADYDGWKKGRGGIHSFYESACVSALGLNLTAEVHQAAEALRQQAVPWTNAIDRIRAVSLHSVQDMAVLDSLDVILAPSVESNKTYAKRPPVAEAAARFEPLITEELARSALLLSEMWDAAYEAGGKPNLKAYRSYQYPMSPDYVPVDYTSTRVSY